MEKHITFCAILNIVFSILGVIAGILIFAVLTGTGIISGDEEAITVLSIIGTVLGSVFIIVSLPGIIGGFGLLHHKSWARILLIIVAILDLFNIPFGTIVGGYTIWVLMQDETIKLLSAKVSG